LLAQPESTASQDIALPQALALALFYLGIWAVIGRYHGLQHDAQIYVVQALALLRPDVYAGDLYLKFGSQDQFTLFSNFCAPWIDAFGVDHGAAALTFGFLALWTWAAWLLVKHLGGARDAWLATGLLLVLPGWYGAGRVFELAELFLSARLPAQGLSLLAIVAAVRGFRWLAIVLLVAAFVIHPLMALPVIITLGVLILVKHDSWKTVLLVTLALSAACVVAGAVLGGSQPLMTGDWLAAVRSRSNYLFVDNWTIDDWQNAGLVLLTAAFATRLPVGDWARRISVAAVCTAVAGLLATAFVSLVVPLRIVIQGQPWRWIWIATLLAIALLPRTLRLMWTASDAGKAAALLLSIAWLMNGVGAEGSQLTGMRLPFAAIAVGLIAFQHRLPGRTASLLLRGAWLVAGLCLLWVASIVATETGLDFDFGGDPAWIQRIGGALLSPAVAVPAVVAAWWLASRRINRAGAMVVAVLGAALALGAAPQAWAQWSAERFGDAQRREFAGWRDRIGPDQEVLWPDGLQASWFILERRSYLSLSQLGGIVFSETLAAEARIRADALSKVFPAEKWFHGRGDPASVLDGDDPTLLKAVCGAPGFAFFVSGIRLDPDALRAEWPTKGMHVYLHDCIQLDGTTP
jgi:hypothetical protein